MHLLLADTLASILQATFFIFLLGVLLSFLQATSRSGENSNE
jgi:hypothetical protein